MSTIDKKESKSGIDVINNILSSTLKQCISLTEEALDEAREAPSEGHARLILQKHKRSMLSKLELVSGDQQEECERAKALITQAEASKDFEKLKEDLEKLKAEVDGLIGK